MQLRDAVGIRRRPEREWRHPESGFVGLHLAERREFVPREAAALDDRLDAAAHELGIEHLVPGRHGRVRGEDGRRAQPVERGVAVEALLLDELTQPLQLEERRVPFVHVEHRRLEAERTQHADAADAEHELLTQPVPPVAAVQRVRHVTGPVRIALHLRVQEIERDPADARAPDADADRNEIALVVGEHDLRRHRHERQRQPDGVVARVALDLVVALVQRLPEVPAEVVQPDADERDAELGRRLQVVPREHAEATGIDREALVQAELGGEVGHEEILWMTVVGLPPARALDLGFEPLLHAA